MLYFNVKPPRERQRAIERQRGKRQRAVEGRHPISRERKIPEMTDPLKGGSPGSLGSPIKVSINVFEENVEYIAFLRSIKAILTVLTMIFRSYDIS